MMSNNNQLLSVIVPIYNTEKYLNKCIDSIIGQTYKNLEIILVNDGSTDNSGEICDNYAQTDERIKVIHKKNEGRNIARREGVLAAKGDIITFVDSDDWLERDMYEKLIEVFLKSGCDMLSSGVIRDYADAGKQEIAYDGYAEGLYSKLDMQIYPTMLWNYDISDIGIVHNLFTKLYKKDTILPILLNINNDIFYGEDCLICMAYCLKIKKIYILHKAYYHYNIRSDSTCRMPSAELLNNSYLLYTELKKLFMGYINPQILMGQLKRYILEINKHSLELLFDINLNAYDNWTFDYDLSLFDGAYIIYGAGACGQALYKQLKQHGKHKNMSAWADKKAEGKSDICLHKIITPKEIGNCKYDFIVIAVKDKEVADNIRRDLVDVYGVDSKKIVWKSSVQKSIYESCIF